MFNTQAVVEQINMAMNLSSAEFEKNVHLDLIPSHLRKVLKLLVLAKERRAAALSEFRQLETDTEYRTIVQCVNVLKCCVVTKTLPKGQYKAKLKTVVSNAAKLRSLFLLTDDSDYKARYYGMFRASKELLAIYYEETEKK